MMNTHQVVQPNTNQVFNKFTYYYLNRKSIVPYKDKVLFWRQK